MARAAASLPRADSASVRRLRVIPGFGGGPPPTRTAPPISNAQLAVVIFIAFETMVFAGFIVAYWVLRANSFAWPPPNLPRLPLAVTGVNTAMLLLSGFAMRRSVHAARAQRSDGLRAALEATAILGTAFVVVQGSEWVRLIHQGLHLSSGTYGATFYTLIGLHAVHVVGAVIWLLAVLGLTYRRQPSPKLPVYVQLCATYWYFVCALWVVLFVAVYLY
jgi:cytochrome c oxidase subunit III